LFTKSSRVKCIAFTLLFFVQFFCYGQTDDALPADAEFSSDDTTEYYIRDFIFHITGFTRQSAIIYNAELAPGERITGSANLEKYRERKSQVLRNFRALDSVEILCIVGEIEENGFTPVDLDIIIKDSWNIIALPKPQYDDNTGFELTLKARDSNFLGSLNPLRVDFGYTLDEEHIWDFSKGSFNIMVDSDLPFRFMGYNWNLNFDNTVSYIYDEPFFYRNTTGLSIEVPVSFTTATFGIEQNFILNERNDGFFSGNLDENDFKLAYGDYFEALYGISGVYTSWKIPTGIEAGGYGDLVYTPRLTARIPYSFNSEMDYLRNGFSVTVSQKFGFERVDWLDNYREGMDVYIENPNTFNFDRNGWTDSSIILSATVHKKIASFFGISGRLRYQHWFYQHREWTEGAYSFSTAAGYRNGGDVLRGVLDKDLKTDYMLSLNLDFPLQALGFLPSTWFKTP
jgi:hypothetical protein